MHPCVRKTQKKNDDEYVLEAVQKGLINGVGKGKLDLQGTTTRAQAVTVIERILDVNNGKILPNEQATVANEQTLVKNDNKNET